MEPTPFVAPLTEHQSDHWLRRAWVALLVEHRLPYRMNFFIDRLCNYLGYYTKTITQDGFKLSVRRLTTDEQFVQNIIVNHEYTPPGFEISQSDTVVDVGGNIGTFALLAGRSASKGRVFTFEPNRENYELLLRNIALNGATNIIATKAAVAASKGALKLFCAGDGGFHSTQEGRIRDSSAFELVDALCLKDVFDDHGIERCDFMKLDCEGAEYEILYGLPKEYFGRIQKIAMEYHGGEDTVQLRKDAGALVSHLQSMGFRIDAYIEFVDYHCGHIRATNLN